LGGQSPRSLEQTRRCFNTLINSTTGEATKTTFESHGRTSAAGSGRPNGPRERNTKRQARFNDRNTEKTGGTGVPAGKKSDYC
jgi:hypothetical protein